MRRQVTGFLHCVTAGVWQPGYGPRPAWRRFEGSTAIAGAVVPSASAPAMEAREPSWPLKQLTECQLQLTAAYGRRSWAHADRHTRALVNKSVDACLNGDVTARLQTQGRPSSAQNTAYPVAPSRVRFVPVSVPVANPVDVLVASAMSPSLPLGARYQPLLSRKGACSVCPCRPSTHGAFFRHRSLDFLAGVATCGGTGFGRRASCRVPGERPCAPLTMKRFIDTSSSSSQRVR